MHYSYEFKRKCVEMYYRGEYPDTPEGISTNRFHGKVREWVRIESKKTVALSSGISEGQLYQWVRKYKIYGYNGLIPKQKGRKGVRTFV